MIDIVTQTGSYKERLLIHVDSLADSSHAAVAQLVAGVYTLGELLDRPTTTVPQLISPLLPRQGVAMLAGSSDTGKSSFLRQLALAIALGEQDFLGFPIEAVHNHAKCNYEVGMYQRKLVSAYDLFSLRKAYPNN